MNATAQPAIFSQGAPAHLHLQFKAYSEDDFVEATGKAASFALELPSVNKVGIVVGFRPSGIKEKLFSDLENDINDFSPIVGKDGFTMPANQQDIWVWLTSAKEDSLFDTGTELLSILGSTTELVDERKGFSYRDGRDLTGFIDGTENPSLSEAAQVALISEGKLRGASLCLLQIWRHDLKSFAKLDTGAQEDVFGRTKSSSEELDDSKKPHNSHIARVVIEENHGELEIFRQSVPYGNLTEHGLVFLAFTAEQRRIELMLKNMAGASEDGIRDALTSYSTPLSGAYYFVPTIEMLRYLSQDQIK